MLSICLNKKLAGNLTADPSNLNPPQHDDLTLSKQGQVMNILSVSYHLVWFHK